MGTLMKILNKNDSQGSKTRSGKEEVKRAGGHRHKRQKRNERLQLRKERYGHQTHKLLETKASFEHRCFRRADHCSKRLISKHIEIFCWGRRFWKFWIVRLHIELWATAFSSYVSPHCFADCSGKGRKNQPTSHWILQVSKYQSKHFKVLPLTKARLILGVFCITRRL